MAVLRVLQAAAEMGMAPPYWKLYDNPFYVAAIVEELQQQAARAKGEGTAEIEEKRCPAPAAEEGLPALSFAESQECQEELLREELLDVWRIIQELELVHDAAKTRLANLSKQSEEAKSTTREPESSLQGMKQKLEEQRNANRLLELENQKLAKQVADMKLSVLETRKETSAHIKAKKVAEAALLELAKESERGRSSITELREMAALARKEAEDARKVMQMGEVWKEERVQARLLEPRFYTESRSIALDNLSSAIQDFLLSKKCVQQNSSESGCKRSPRFDDARLLLLNGSKFHHAQSREHKQPAARRPLAVPKIWPSSIRFRNSDGAPSSES